MACSYRVLAEAQRDLDSIVAYLLDVSDGPSAAKGFLNELDEKEALVCENPLLFSLSRMPDLAALGYRTFLVKSYVVLFFYRDDCVYVAHVFHQRQDYARLV